MIPKYLLVICAIININYIVIIQSSDNNNKDGVECKRASKILQDCFLEPLSPEQDSFLKNTKIPLNENEIKLKCTVFKKGLNCFNNYTKKCLTDEKYKLYQNSVSGARQFEGKLCDDKRFQTEFLKHKECFVLIKDDWNKCSTDFQNILTDELHKTTVKPETPGNKFLQFCCSRYAYETCVYSSARYKCLKTSLKFVRYITRLLSNENHFKNCPNYEAILCTACNIQSMVLVYVIIAFSLLLLS